MLTALYRLAGVFIRWRCEQTMKTIILLFIIYYNWKARKLNLLQILYSWGESRGGSSVSKKGVTQHKGWNTAKNRAHSKTYGKLKRNCDVLYRNQTELGRARN